MSYVVPLARIKPNSQTLLYLMSCRSRRQDSLSLTTCGAHLTCILQVLATPSPPRVPQPPRHERSSDQEFQHDCETPSPNAPKNSFRATHHQCNSSLARQVFYHAARTCGGWLTVCPLWRIDDEETRLLKRSLSLLCLPPTPRRARFQVLSCFCSLPDVMLLSFPESSWRVLGNVVGPRVSRSLRADVGFPKFCRWPGCNDVTCGGDSRGTSLLLLGIVSFRFFSHAGIIGPARLHSLPGRKSDHVYAHVFSTIFNIRALFSPAVCVCFTPWGITLRFKTLHTDKNERPGPGGSTAACCIEKGVLQL